MKGTERDRNFEEIEIIDIRSEEDLRQTWDEFNTTTLLIRVFQFRFRKVSMPNMRSDI